MPDAEPRRMVATSLNIYFNAPVSRRPRYAPCPLSSCIGLHRGRSARRTSTIADATFLSREWALNNPPLHLHGVVSASIGIAEHISSKDGNLLVEQEKSELLRRADSAMYQAKSQGKNQVVVSRA